MPIARGHVQIEHGVLFHHMAVCRVLSNDNVTALHETISGLNVHHRSALCCADNGNGGRVHALSVCSAKDVFSTGAKPVQADNVHLRRSWPYMFFFHPKSRKYI